MVYFLIGYMGSGKSSIGREAARRTGIRFVDMDRQIEHEVGMTVSEIFSSMGESFFRSLERNLLQRIVAGGGDVLVATGGGVPVCDGNMDLMNVRGKTIYLRLSPNKLVSRLKAGQQHRPKLQGMDKEEILHFVEDNLPLREPFYARASMIIDCDAMSDDVVCKHVQDFIKNTDRLR